MTTAGMNVAEVRHLAQQLVADGEKLRSLVSTIDGRVHSSSWVGRDADRFRHEWWPQHRSALLNAAEAIEGLGRSASNNADDQERASGVKGASGASAGNSWTFGRVVGDFAGGFSAFGHSPLIAADGLLLGALGLSSKLAPGKASEMLKTWSGYYGRIMRDAPGPMRALLGKAMPAFRAADRNAFLDLRKSPVTNWVRSSGKTQDLLRAIDKSSALTKVGRVLGFVGIGTELADAAKDWQGGDKTGAALHVVDAGAAALKASHNPLLFGAGVGIDAVTDVIDIARGKEKWTNWRPWSLL